MEDALRVREEEGRQEGRRIAMRTIMHYLWKNGMTLTDIKNMYDFWNKGLSFSETERIIALENKGLSLQEAESFVMKKKG